MDLSIVATVGSFAFSERVLKPKATVLVILGMLLAYDLTTKTQDVSSLRVYRGPIMLVFTLTMVAYSLRTWRRNGVACDEFIFLPGTRHGHCVGIEGPLIETIHSSDEFIEDDGDEYEDYDYEHKLLHQQELQSRYEHEHEREHKQEGDKFCTKDKNSKNVTMSTLASTYNNIASATDSLSTVILTTQQQIKPISVSKLTVSTKVVRVLAEKLDSAAAVKDNLLGHNLEMVSLTTSNEKSLERSNSNGSIMVDESTDAHTNNSSNNLSSNFNTPKKGNRSNGRVTMDSKIKGEGPENIDPDADGIVNVNVNIDNSIKQLTRTEYSEPESPGTAPSTTATATTTSNGCIRGRLRHYIIEHHPQLAKLWTFFFNRSAGSSNANATYAPSGPAVFGAALDLSMPVLFNFHVFIMTFNHIQKPTYVGSELPVNILPIGFLAVLYARTLIPPSRRARFWGTMKFTFAAPFHRVDVRDEFIGDCLTSWVRPAQDLWFATIYFFVIIGGTASGRYGITRTGEILAESWWVHNVILPNVGILPLFLKYLQTLRQAYDANKRWPYLGNTFKYLSAALVIIYGTTHPDQRRSYTWMSCFIVSIFYQLFWDVVMDWQLFEIQRDISVVIGSSGMGGMNMDMNMNMDNIRLNATTSADSSTSTTSLTSTISSFRPDSRILLGLQMYLIQPINDRYQRFRVQIPGWRSIQLRERRLYKKKSFYWKILSFNILTRFTWMLCFIPAYHVSQSATVATVVLTSQ